jgi:hypothetical protein
MPPAAPLVFDENAAHPDVWEVRVALAGKDWAAVTATVVRHHGGARTQLIRWAGGTADRAFLESVRAADPADSLAAALLGERMTNDAWAIRTRNLARDVSAAQFQRFHAMLREAEEMLVDAVAHNPADPAVWCVRLITARGLEVGQAEARRRYTATAALDPHHLPAQAQLQQQLCPKWGGSWAEMDAFAQDATHAAPEGAHNGVLVADALYEHLLLDPGNRDKVLRNKANRQSLAEAADRSVLHPAFERTFGWVAVANSFALMLSLVEDWGRAKRVFEIAGPWVTDHPWHLVGDPVEKFARYRSRAAGSRWWRPW